MIIAWCLFFSPQQSVNRLIKCYNLNALINTKNTKVIIFGLPSDSYTHLFVIIPQHCCILQSDWSEGINLL